ncbi:MAG: 30S ribosomal protein S17 [Chloracidobacterium sp.]|nr:30S ribosomal protein S17 [Chloracidobacterium sp.]MDW8217305.1 30S ribosomal protein S17 [Acidobacteriota bacterium]
MSKLEKVGLVVSNKMRKTVTVRIERLVMHPVYKKFIRRHSKFLAHDELSCKVGDKVRIVESRPLSARKRWVVKEIIQRNAMGK